MKNTLENIKDFIVESYNGFSLFIESLSLLVVAGFAFYGVNTYEMRMEYKYVIFGAAVIIALRGAYEFLRNVRKLGAK